MKDRRTRQRRNFTLATRFPVRTQSGKVIVSDRRRLATRRLNDIKVEELGYSEFIAALRWGRLRRMDQSY